MKLSSQDLRALLEALPDPIVIVDRRGIIAFASVQIQNLLGYSAEELTGMPVDMLLPERLRDLHAVHRERFMADPAVRFMGANQGLWARRKDGSEVAVEISLSPHETSHGLLVVGSLRDVTSHKRLEQRLVDEIALSNSLLEHAPTIVLVLDPTGRIIRINEYLEKVSGYRADEVLGKSWFAIFLPEEDRDGVESLFHDVLCAGTNPGHVNAILAKDGSVRQIEWRSTVLKDGNGQAAALLSIGNDITERIQLEASLRRARQEADRSNAEKSRFLAAASHDLRQPLQSMGIYLSVLSRRLESAEQRQTAEKIQTSLDMMGELLNTLLDVAKLDSGAITVSKRDFRLQTLLDRVVSDNLPIAREKSLELVCGEYDHVVHSDPGLLERVIENLIGNAIRYTKTGRITVECSQQQGTLRLSVVDTGIGIPENALDKLFDEYFQLDNPSRDRRKGLGLGLGLSIVKRIMQMLGHKLEVASIPGSGSTFSMILPLGDALGVAAKPRSLSQMPSPQDCESVVLLVDDDPAILDASTMLLESAGIEVRPAANGRDALAMVEDGLRFDVVISDYRLPDYSGVELIRRLRLASGQEKPAIIMTGDTSAQEIERANLRHCMILCKPVDSVRIIELVESLTADTFDDPGEDKSKSTETTLISASLAANVSSNTTAGNPQPPGTADRQAGAGASDPIRPRNQIMRRDDHLQPKQ